MSGRGQRIVIVTPGQLGSNPRVVKEASALHAAGLDVHVIATKVVDFVEPRDQAVLSHVPWSAERVAFDDRASWRRERLLQVTARCAQRMVPSARVASYAHSAFARRIAAAAMARPADLYIAHYPAALEGAARAAAAHGARFAFDAEDFHLGDLPDRPEHASARGLISSLEARHLPYAAYVTAASPGIADAYAKAYAIPRPTVVLNVFDAASSPDAPTPKGTEPGPSLYWFSQVVGPDRGLECALEAIARARSAPHLYLRGTPRQTFIGQLRARAAELGCTNRLHILDSAPPAQMEQLASAYDLGFVGETGRTLNHRIMLSNKQFTYLLAGIPALLTDIPSHVAFAAEADGATFLYRTEDPASLAAVLDDLLSDPQRLAAARARAFALGRERYNWERESQILVDLVQRTLRDHRTVAV